MTEAHPYDDRLSRHDHPDQVVQQGDILAEELAERHYEECWDVPICRNCIPDTPLAEDRAEWAEYSEELIELADAVVQEVARMEAEATRTPRPWIYGTYYDRFMAVAVPSSECSICPDG